MCVRFICPHVFIVFTVRTRTPENCEIFAQRYQSQPITQKFQKTLLIFSEPSETMSKYFFLGTLCIIFKVFYNLNLNNLSIRTDRTDKTVKTLIRLLLDEQSDQGLHC